MSILLEGPSPMPSAKRITGFLVIDNTIQSDHFI
jgi:hypothetical protein